MTPVDPLALTVGITAVVVLVALMGLIVWMSRR